MPEGVVASEVALQCTRGAMHPAVLRPPGEDAGAVRGVGYGAMGVLGAALPGTIRVFRASGPDNGAGRPRRIERARRDGRAGGLAGGRAGVWR